MKKLTKENLEEFLTYYNGLHDSLIRSVNYDIKTATMEMFIDVFWAGKPTLKKNNKYDTGKTKLKIVFNGVEKCNIKEIFSFDYIMNGYVRYVKWENKEYICFSDDEEKPKIYVLSDEMLFEEIGIRDNEIIKVHEELEKVYEKAKQVFARLKDKCTLGYFNKHLLKVNNKYIEQDYYMPVISMQDKGDICFNFDDVSYEFYLSRANVDKYLDTLIEKYNDRLSLYPMKDCDVDLFDKKDSLEEVRKKLEQYDLEEIIGIGVDANELEDEEVVINFLKLVELFEGEKEWMN